MAIVANLDHSLDRQYLADHVVALIDELQVVLTEESRYVLVIVWTVCVAGACFRRARESHIPSAAKILQPKDKHIFSMGGYTSPSSVGLMSRSEHLYNGQELLRRYASNIPMMLISKVDLSLLVAAWTYTNSFRAARIRSIGI